MGSNIFEVRIKNNGRIFSRHYTANTSKQAAMRAKGKGRILSVKKIHAEDIIGTIKSMSLENIIGANSQQVKRRQDVILEETTLESIVFPNPAMRRRKNRRFNDERKRERTTEGRK